METIEEILQDIENAFKDYSESDYLPITGHDLKDLINRLRKSNSEK